MPAPAYSQGDVLLARLVFSDGQGSKRRPVLVVPITSQAARGAADVTLSDWQQAGLRLPSTVRVEKMATLEKSCVERKLGGLPANELEKVRGVLAGLFKRIIG